MTKKHRLLDCRGLCLVWVLWCCLSVGTTPVIVAQGIGGGANYSLLGLGDIRESLGATFEGMGGTAIGVTSPVAVNFTNPAAWSYLRSTRFQTGFTFRQHVVTSNSGTARQNNGDAQGFAVGFSIDTSFGMSASLGLIPTTHVNYAFAQQQALYSTRYTGRGGLSQLYLGASVQPLKNLAVGVSAGYNFGTIVSADSITFNDGTFISTANATTITDALSGVSVNTGLQFTGLENWTFGVIAGFSSPLSIQRQVAYRYIAGVDSVEISTSSTVMPLVLGIGISHTIGRTTLALDAVTKDFSGFSYRAQSIGRFRRSNRVSLGVSYGASADYNATFFERISYNFGAGYHQQYYQIGSTGIDEVYGTFGMDIPLTRRSYVGVSVMAGSRGTTDNGLVRELFGRASFTVNIGEIWFQPFFKE